MTIPLAQALALDSLVVSTPAGVASRVLAKAPGGTITLFAFDEGQGLKEHTTPFGALVLVVSGRIRFTIAQQPVDAAASTIVNLPANVPHAVDALEASRMLLMMVK